jgi:hypothetical protein
MNLPETLFKNSFWDEAKLVDLQCIKFINIVTSIIYLAMWATKLIFEKFVLHCNNMIKVI